VDERLRGETRRSNRGVCLEWLGAEAELGTQLLVSLKWTSQKKERGANWLCTELKG